MPRAHNCRWGFQKLFPVGTVFRTKAGPHKTSNSEGLRELAPIGEAVMKPGGWKHNQETNAKISAARRAQLSDPAERAKISELTKARMADPAVRQRIRDGMLRASGAADELRTLRAVWRATRSTVRARFLAELLEPICHTRREGDQS